MKFSLPILLLLFAGCAEKKKAVSEIIDVIDTQMAEVRGASKDKFL